MNIVTKAQQCYEASEREYFLTLLFPASARNCPADDSGEPGIVFTFEDGSDLYYIPRAGGFWAWSDEHVAQAAQ